MAILAILAGPRINRDQYELLRKEVDWEHRHPEGMILHTASFDAAGGLRVADVWASQETMLEFFDGRLLPAMRKHKISPPSKRDVYPLHAAFAGEGIEQFRAREISR